MPGTCTEQGGCSFNIDITNNSGKPLPEVVISDELTAGAANLGGATIEGAPPAPWTCTAPPKFSCKHPGIADGETVSLPLSFAPKGIGQEKELKNCATVQTAGAEGAVPAAPLPAPAPAELNGIRLEQTPKLGPCSPLGGCEVEIKITNTTAAPQTGRLVIMHTASLPPNEKGLSNVIEKLTPPPQMQCGQFDDFKLVHCTTDAATPKTLAPGETLTMTLAFRPHPS
ncbi:MAG: hypothetical protein WDN31_01980 [Hyphomicrobium sp.]